MYARTYGKFYTPGKERHQKLLSKKTSQPKGAESTTIQRVESERWIQYTRWWMELLFPWMVDDIGAACGCDTLAD